MAFRLEIQRIPEAILKRRSDFVIIGSGFGGAFAALDLARAGHEVLVIERGLWCARDESCWDENRLDGIGAQYRGRVPIRVEQMQSQGGRELWTKDTVGGASTFYGAASLRLREEDFMGAPVAGSHARNPSTAWPLGYQELEPFYARAEELLGVAGLDGDDITEPPRSSPFPQSPPDLTGPSERIWKAAERLGLHPARLPLAINFDGKSGKGTCILCSTCDQFPCAVEAKNDLSVGILPAAVRAGAKVLSDTRAVRINASRFRAESVEAVDQSTGERLSIRAGHVIVAGGALASPHLLLSSGIRGEGGGASLLGGYLMRHACSVVAGILPVPANPKKEFHKQVLISDFYRGSSDGAEFPPGPWGLLQSVHMPGKRTLRTNAPRGLKSLAAASSRFLVGLLCIAEEIPQECNRVTPDHRRTDMFGMPRLLVRHRYTARDEAARDALGRKAKKVLREAGAWPVYTLRIETFSHALGTCRFGRDPDSSVLDPFCRVWGFRNLYVLDSSFMPSGGSVNPSLTIAANSIRAAHAILDN